MRYFVKTRNWNCNKLIHKLLALAPCRRGDSYQDGDGKFFFETNSLIIGLLVLFYWLALSHWSGGMTYISDTKKQHRANEYKIFYL